MGHITGSEYCATLTGMTPETLSPKVTRRSQNLQPWTNQAVSRSNEVQSVSMACPSQILPKIPEYYGDLSLFTFH